MTLSELLNKTRDNLKIIPVKVTDVSANLVDGKPLDGTAEVLDAFTKSRTETNGINIVPAIGSTIYVLMSNPPIVLLYDELEEYGVKINDTVLQLDKDGILLQNNQTTLNTVLTDFKKVLDDMVSIMETFKVICSPAGTPSTLVEPTTLTKIQTLKPKITAVKTNIDKLLK